QPRRAELGRTEQAIERAEIRRLEGIIQWLGRRGQESPASARGEPGLLEPDRQGIHDRDASADRRRSDGGVEYKAGDRRVRRVERERALQRFEIQAATANIDGAGDLRRRQAPACR